MRHCLSLLIYYFKGDTHKALTTDQRQTTWIKTNPSAANPAAFLLVVLLTVFVVLALVDSRIGTVLLARKVWALSGSHRFCWIY